MAFLITQNRTRRTKRSLETMKVISLKIKNVHYVQFSIVKCCLYTKNEIYRRGYTSYSDSFIQFVCMFYTIPAIYEIVQVVLKLGVHI